jgi:hypothetical protein
MLNAILNGKHGMVRLPVPTSNTCFSASFAMPPHSLQVSLYGIYAMSFFPQNIHAITVRKEESAKVVGTLPLQFVHLVVNLVASSTFSLLCRPGLSPQVWWLRHLNMSLRCLSRI